MKRGIALSTLLLCSIAQSAELLHQFNSPAFSGAGYSSHVLTIEQLESQRRQKLKDEATAAQAKIDLAAKNTNLSKFLVNVESRIYAQLSKQLADSLFSESSGNSGNMEFQGTSINWLKTATDVTLTITETNGNRTEITVPIGTFGF